MTLEPAPRLNKLPFIFVTIACALAIVLIALLSDNPFAPLPFLTAVGLLIASITAVMVPILIDYAADQAESTQAIRSELDAQIARLQSAAESLTRAAAQIKAVEEAVNKASRDAETLPYRMQEKLAEFNEALAQKDEEQRDALEQELNELRATHTLQLKSAAEKIQKATVELAAIDKAAREQIGESGAAIERLQASAHASGARLAESLGRAAEAVEARIAAAVAALPAAGSARPAGHPTSEPPARLPQPSDHADSSVPPAPVASESQPRPIPSDPSPDSPPEAAALPSKTEPAATRAEPESGPAFAPAAASAAVAVEAGTANPADAPKVKRPRAPRKPKAEELPPEPAPAPIADSPVDGNPIAAADTNGHASAGGDATFGTSIPVASDSTDGATRLLATAYIGIGNKLFIRGDGPGLNWDVGVPMQFVSIGKWGWHTHESTGPIACKLYKNDETPALSGEFTLEPNRHTEVTALF